MNDGFQPLLSLRSLPWGRAMQALWAITLAATVVGAVMAPAPTTIAIPLLLAVVFAATKGQQRLSERVRHRGLRDLQLRLDNASYLNEFQSLPNRNYMLDQLRREMPRARHTGEPFVLVIISMADVAGIVQRRGEEFSELAKRSLARLIERFTRASDFAAELGEGSFGILLYECDSETAEAYLRRIPPTLAVSTGKRMLEIPLKVQMSAYDMESVYAIDVLREAEEGEPARPEEPLRFGAEAA